MDNLRIPSQRKEDGRGGEATPALSGKPYPLITFVEEPVYFHSGFLIQLEGCFVFDMGGRILLSSSGRPQTHDPLASVSQELRL
jgi:hypothetical protein